MINNKIYPKLVFIHKSKLKEKKRDELVTDNLGNSWGCIASILNMRLKLNSFIALLIFAIFVGILNGINLTEVLTTLKPDLEVLWEVWH